MGAGMLVLIIMGITACSTLVAYADLGQGIGTYYNSPYVPSACFGYQDNGVMVAGVSDAIWNNGAACGRMYQVTCIGAVGWGPQDCTGVSAVVKIVDYCPGCPGPINLSEDAFNVIANTAAGEVQIGYQEVE